MAEKDKIVYISAMDWGRLGNISSPILYNDHRSVITDNGDGCVRVSQHGQTVDLLIPNTLVVRAVVRPAPRPEKDPGEEEITAVESPRRRVAMGRPTEMG